MKHTHEAEEVAKISKDIFERFKKIKRITGYL